MARTHVFSHLREKKGPAARQRGDEGNSPYRLAGGDILQGAK